MLCHSHRGGGRCATATGEGVVVSQPQERGSLCHSHRGEVLVSQPQGRGCCFTATGEGDVVSQPQGLSLIHI